MHPVVAPTKPTAASSLYILLNGRAVTVATSLPYQADVTRCFEPLLDAPLPVLLQSAGAHNDFGRYDVFSADPIAEVRYDAGRISIAGKTTTTSRPFEAAAAAVQHRLTPRAPPANGDTPPFTAGFIGYFGYSLHADIERQRPAPAPPLDWPQLAGGIYDWSVVTDHVRRTTTLFLPPEPARQREVRNLIATRPRPPRAAVDLGAFRSTFSERSYRAAFAAVKEYINAGDCYQVNLARHYRASARGDPWQLYRTWLRRQPGPYAAFLSFPFGALISLSPERFVRTTRQRDGAWSAHTAPIKGTSARGANSADDHRSAVALAESHKERAENLMIVDLLRNDLGRICDQGTIRVEDFCRVMSLDNVHHLVSTIRGRLACGTRAGDVLRALFPCGSVTGAPKIRSIDIINELEPTGRSVYCGSVGSISVDGTLNTSVAIRTAAVTPTADNAHDVHLWGGGAVVADSVADRELAEIDAKVGRLMTL